MFKKIIILVICSFITISPCIYTFNYSYADSAVDPEWTFIQDSAYNMQKTFFCSAIKAYINTQKTYLNFTYRQNQAIVQWTYDNFNSIATSANLGSLSDYYDQVAYAMDNDGNFKFWYTASGLRFMDDLLQAVLTEYGIVTDNQEETIYSGEYFRDDDNYGCFVYNSKYKASKWFDNTNQIFTKLGTQYKYESNHFNSIDQYAIFNVNNYQYSFTTTNNSNYKGSFLQFNTPSSNNSFIYALNAQDKYSNVYTYNSVTGDIILFRYLPNSTSLDDYNHLFIGTFVNCLRNDVNVYSIGFLADITNNANDYIHNEIIDIAKRGASNAASILGKQAVIDLGKIGADAAISAINHLEDPDETEPDIEPSDPSEQPPINPGQPSIPVGIVNNMPITIQLPNLDDLIPNSIPQLPHGFSIPGLRYKFPFCIPFDLIAVYEVLDTTPQAPHFETEINFATFNYDLNIDLEDYNPYMVHIRNYFLILYIFGLLFITPKLLKA